MPLPAGLRLASYEIVAPLGAGAMGEVYSYDVASDGQRFLVTTDQSARAESASPPITVVVNWAAATRN